MEIQYTKTALKALEKLTTKLKISIIKAIQKIPHGDIKDLKGFSDNRKRLRVGKYRVIYKITNTNKIEILVVMDIGTRGDIYKQ